LTARTADPGVAARETGRLRVVLCWHLHQPCYRDLASGEFVLPWVYLYALRDYGELAHHFEMVPGATAVVSVSPLLLEQLDAYVAALAGWLSTGRTIPDRLLAALADGVPSDPADWAFLVRMCLAASPERAGAASRPFRALLKRARRWCAGISSGVRPAGPTDEFDAGDLEDLVVWCHLLSCGESLRRGDSRIAGLTTRAGGFTAFNRRTLVEAIYDALGGLVPRFRRLLGNGQIELAVSPWGHPVVPLLLDVGAPCPSDPGAVLPEQATYPGGSGRARWHLARAVQAFTRTFGVRPSGCWPANGALDMGTAALLETFGFSWCASGADALRSTLEPVTAVLDPSPAHRPWGIAGNRLGCFFGDETLAALLTTVPAAGAGAAVAEGVVARLEDLARGYAGDPARIVSIVVGAEQPWAEASDDRPLCLSTLCRRLADHPLVELTTFSAALAAIPGRLALVGLAAGSARRERFREWIGSTAKDRVWELLCEAKRVFDQVVVEGNLEEGRQLAAEYQLGVLEGSDWATWVDAGHDEDSVASVDALYRRHLGNLYALLGEAAPSDLGLTIAARMVGPASLARRG